MAYNFIKLSDAPVAEDGATHVLGTKEGQVVRVPASGLSAVALDLEIAGDSAGPTSVLDASTRDANRLAGATLVTSVMRGNYGEARMLRLFADNLGYIAIYDIDPGEM